MFKYPDASFRTNPPTHVVLDGIRRKFTDLTREQWDGLGYNEAMPLTREPYTTYVMQWVKGEDLIYRETVVSAVVDEEARAEAVSEAVRVERDRLLAACDWTQLADSVLDEAALVLWQSYRQALRDVPQQAGFPDTVAWPAQPEAE